MQNARLYDSQAGIKIAGRNINNLRYADDTILMEKESERSRMSDKSFQLCLTLSDPMDYSLPGSSIHGIFQAKYWSGVPLSSPFDFMDHNKLWKILKEMGILDHLTCLLRNLYASQEATVRTGHGTTDWFEIGKGVHQGCIFSPCLFNLCAEYIMRNAGLDEPQARIKMARRNINNHRYADDTTLITKSEEEPKELLDEGKRRE